MDSRTRRRAQDFSVSLSTIESQTPNSLKGQDLSVMGEKYCDNRTTPNIRNSGMRKSSSVPDIVLPEKEKFSLGFQQQYKSFDDSIFMIEQRRKIIEEKASSDWETFNSHGHFIRSSESEYGSAQTSLSVTPRRRYPGVRLKLEIPNQISHCKSPVLSSLAAKSSKVNSSSGFINSNSISSANSSMSSTASMSREWNSQPKYPSSKLKSPRKMKLRSISPIDILPIQSRKESAGISSRKGKTPSLTAMNTDSKKGIRSVAGGKTPTRTTQVPTAFLTPNNLFRGLSDIPKSSTKENSMPSIKNSQRTPTQRRFCKTPERSSPCSDRSGTRPKSSTKSYITGFSDIDGYKAVKSPVAEYIRGTDIQLVQNVRAKTNMLLLTPRSRGNAAGASCEDLKFKLAKAENDQGDSNISSPILDHQARVNRKNTPGNYDFKLPEINYELPSQVYEIVGSPSKVRGPHTKLLRQVTENRIVTRHESRGVQTLVDSANQDLADMSIHVTKTALKTDCKGRSKL